MHEISFLLSWLRTIMNAYFFLRKLWQLVLLGIHQFCLILDVFKFIVIEFIVFTYYLSIPAASVDIYMYFFIPKIVRSFSWCISLKKQLLVLLFFLSCKQKSSFCL